MRTANPQNTFLMDRDKMKFSDIINRLSDEEKETLMEIGYNYLKFKKGGDFDE